MWFRESHAVYTTSWFLVKDIKKNPDTLLLISFSTLCVLTLKFHEAGKFSITIDSFLFLFPWPGCMTADDVVRITILPEKRVSPHKLQKAGHGALLLLVAPSLISRTHKRNPDNRERWNASLLRPMSAIFLRVCKVNNMVASLHSWVKVTKLTKKKGTDPCIKQGYAQRRQWSVNHQFLYLSWHVWTLQNISGCEIYMYIHIGTCICTHTFIYTHMGLCAAILCPSLPPHKWILVKDEKDS